jgi:hypothetical protein
MFKQIRAWVRSFRETELTVYGIRTTGPRGLHEVVPLRTIVVKKKDLHEPVIEGNPRALKRLGPTEKEHRAKGKAHMIAQLPDECAFF